MVGVLALPDEPALEAAQTRLTRRFGPLAAVSLPTAFDHTDYYADEMGTGLFRRFWCFYELLPQEDLAAAKLFCQDLEEDLAGPVGARRVNLDPGILTQERLVLASGKQFTHKVYLGQGVWADLTLIFQRGRWQTQPWTFPDFRHAGTLALLTDFRRYYRRRIGIA